MAPMQDLPPDLSRAPAEAHSAQVGGTLASHAGDAVAAQAASGLECLGAQILRPRRSPACGNDRYQ